MAHQIITEEEYDRLSDNSQAKYWYCAKCGNYVLRSWSKHCPCRKESK